jgi:hypothetical protein
VRLSLRKCRRIERDRLPYDGGAGGGGAGGGGRGPSAVGAGGSSSGGGSSGGGRCLVSGAGAGDGVCGGGSEYVDRGGAGRANLIRQPRPSARNASNGSGTECGQNDRGAALCIFVEIAPDQRQDAERDPGSDQHSVLLWP